MHQMVLLVLDDVNMCSPVLDAWEAAGVSGITILESTGLGRVRQSSIRDDLPLMPSMRELLKTREEHHRTLFTVVEDEEVLDNLIEATKNITGDLSIPNRGLLIVLPVSRVIGLGQENPE